MNLCGLVVVVIILLFGAAYAQQTTTNAANPRIIQKQLSHAEAKKFLIDQCETERAIEILNDQMIAVSECIFRYLNYSEIEFESEHPEIEGWDKRILQKYCNRLPDVNKCFPLANRSTLEELCFNYSFAIVIEIQEFFCSDNGSRLAIFEYRGGDDCLVAKKRDIKTCLVLSVGNVPGKEVLSQATLGMFLFTKRDCLDYDKFHKCVIGVLKKCPDSVPLYMVDSCLKYFRRRIVCGPYEAIGLEVFLYVVLSVVLINFVLYILIKIRSYQRSGIRSIIAY